MMGVTFYPQGLVPGAWEEEVPGSQWMLASGAESASRLQLYVVDYSSLLYHQINLEIPSTTPMPPALTPSAYNRNFTF